MDTWIYVDPLVLEVLHEKVKNRIDLDLFQEFWEPLGQPEPGCKIGVTSLRQQERLAVQTLHVVHNPADNGLHCLVITGEQTPVDPLPVV